MYVVHAAAGMRCSLRTNTSGGSYSLTSLHPGHSIGFTFNVPKYSQRQPHRSTFPHTGLNCAWEHTEAAGCLRAPELSMLPPSLEHKTSVTRTSCSTFSPSGSLHTRLILPYDVGLLPCWSPLMRQTRSRPSRGKCSMGKHTAPASTTVNSLYLEALMDQIEPFGPFTRQTLSGYKRPEENTHSHAPVALQLLGRRIWKPLRE